MAKWEEAPIIRKANKWEEAPIVERGLAGEAGAAVVRTFLGEAKGLTGTYGSAVKAGIAAPLPALIERIRPGTLTEPIEQAVIKIRSAEQKFQPTRQDKAGWVVNTLAGGGTQLGINLVAGQKLGWIGPAVNMFSVARQNTLDAGGSELEADLTGLSEAALEAWGVSRLLKFKEAGKGSFKALINNVRKGLMKQAAGNLKNIGINALKSALVEGLEEVSQGGAEFLWELLPGGRDIPRKADGSVDWWNIVGSLAEQGAGGALVGGVIPVGAGGVAAGVETAVGGRKAGQVPVQVKSIPAEKRVEIISIKNLQERAVGIPKGHANKLRKSLQEKGFIQPVIADKKTGRVLDGLKRLSIARDMGIKKVPVIYVDQDQVTKADIDRLSQATSEAEIVTQEQPIEQPIQRAIPEFQKEAEQYDALVQKISEGNKQAIGKLNNLVQGFNRPTYDSLLERVQNGDKDALRLIEQGYYQGGKSFGVVQTEQITQPTEQPVPEQEQPQFPTQEKPTKQEKPKPPRMGRRKLLKLGHDIPKALGWDDAQRRDFMQQAVGKPSMKGMKPKEMKVLVQALQEKARDAGLLPPEGYEKTLFIGPKEVETKKFFDDIVQTTQDLKGKKQLRKEKVITRKGEKKQFSLVRAAKELLVGIDNDSIPHLLNRIGGTKEGSIKDLITNYRRSVHNISSVYRGSVDMLNEALDKAGVTPKDLVEWSVKLDPRFELIKRGRELVGKPKTKQYTITLNGEQYKVSMAELLDIYLCAQQEVGMNHITNAGLKIFGRKTGAITEEQLQPILDIVKTNPKAMAFADAVVDIATNYIAPQLNYTDGRLNPESLEKLADEKNYWHLHTDKPLLIKGKETYGISFLENKRILKPRTKGTKGALVISDALSKFLSVQYAAAEYVGMAEEMRLLNMTLNYQPVIDNLESKGYADIRSNLKTLIEWAQGSKGNYTRTDALLAKVLHGSYRAVLHFSPEVIMAQYMSTGHYAGMVDVKYVPLLSVPPTPKLVHEMLKHNPVVWMRYYAGGQSAELAETGELDTTLRLLSGKRADLNKTGIASQITDLSAFAQGWKLAKAIITDTTNLKEGSPEYFDAVNDKAEELWDTQPSWDKWNKSINTSQRGIKKLPFLFRSYFEKSLMMLHTANAKYNASNKTTNDKAKWAQTYGAVLGSQAATALMRLAMAHLVWRKRKTVWDLIAAIVAAPLPMVGIVGGFLNRVVTNFFRITGGQKQAWEGEPISNLAESTIEDLFKGIGQMTKAASYYINGNERMAKVEVESAIRNILISVGTIKGVPVRQVEKTIKAVEGENAGTRTRKGGGYVI